MANIRTFHDLQTETLAWLDEAGDTHISLTLVKQALRAAHEKRLSEERWSFMLSEPKTLTLVNGQQNYILDENILRLMYVLNRTTGDPLVEFTDQNAIQAGVFTNPTETATAQRFALWGKSEVGIQPLTPSIVIVVSTNSGDNDQASVTITGETSTGVQSETIACYGSPTVQFSEILKVSKSDGWAGSMMLKDATQTITFLTLLPAEYGKSFLKFHLFDSPTQADVLEYRFYRQPCALSANGDRTDIPAPFEEILVWDALLDLSNYNEVSLSTIQYWKLKRDELQLAMEHTYGMAQTINQQPVSMNYIPR